MATSVDVKIRWNVIQVQEFPKWTTLKNYYSSFFSFLCLSLYQFVIRRDQKKHFFLKDPHFFNEEVKLIGSFLLRYQVYVYPFQNNFNWDTFCLMNFKLSQSSFQNTFFLFPFVFQFNPWSISLWHICLKELRLALRRWKTLSWGLWVQWLYQKCHELSFTLERTVVTNWHIVEVRSMWKYYEMWSNSKIFSN